MEIHELSQGTVNYVSVFLVSQQTHLKNTAFTVGIVVCSIGLMFLYSISGLRATILLYYSKLYKVLLYTVSLKLIVL